jgi:hypothetical protein
MDGLGFKFREEQSIFLFSKTSRPAGGPTSLLFNWYRPSFTRINPPGREDNHISPSTTEVKNEWSYTSTPHICLHGVDRKKLYLLPLPNFIFYHPPLRHAIYNKSPWSTQNFLYPHLRCPIRNFVEQQLSYLFKKQSWTKYGTLNLNFSLSTYFYFTF